MPKHVIAGLIWLFMCASFCQADFRAYNDCIRGQDDTTAENTTDYSIYNGYTTNYTGQLIDFDSGDPTGVTATFTWNEAAGLNTSETSGSDEGESQPRPGTDAYDVFGGKVDFSNRLIYYGSAGWWVKITFTGLDPDRQYRFVTTAIRGNPYLDRLTLFTISDHLDADNISSEGIYSKDGDQSILTAGTNYTNTTGYIVGWEDITVADDGDGTGSFSVMAQATGSNFRAYPFGGFMLEEMPPLNDSPEVSAGEDFTIKLPQDHIQFDGSVTDDGKGNPDGTLIINWTQLSGPDTVEFITDPHNEDVMAFFPEIGDYELQLSANDGLAETTDTVLISVNQAICPEGDVNGDCIVQLADVRMLADQWLAGPIITTADLNGDQRVDITEMELVGQTWMENWTGFVDVTIEPAEVAQAGTRWRINEGQWHYSGETIPPLPQGVHTLEFEIIDDWVRPESQEITITQQQTTTIIGTYTIPERIIEISEFMAVNSNITDLRPLPSIQLYSSINGEPHYDDWIELTNLTDEPISLDGWYLTDDPDNLTKWAFPADTVIPEQGQFFVFASNKDPERYSYPFTDDWGFYHTNFELDGGGEYLAITRDHADGQWIEHEYNDYPKQRGMVTYGIDSTGAEGYLKTITETQPNEEGIYLGIVGDTHFDMDRGFYDSPFNVEITCDTPDAVIRYTLDNALPTETNSLVYSGPITISSTTCLRASAFKEGYLPSNADTHTYIFLDDVIQQASNPDTGQQVTPTGYPNAWISGSAVVTGDYQVDPVVVKDPTYAPTIKEDINSIPTVSLVADIDSLFGSTGIYVNQAQDGTERVGSVEMFDTDGTKMFQTNCGLRMQGGVSGGGTTLNRWKSYKLSFRLVFRGLYGGKLNYPLFGDEGTDSYETFVLDSRPQNSWVHPTAVQHIHAEYVRDQASSDTQLSLGGTACHGRPVQLYLNGMYWGLYWIHERPDDAFAASYLGGEKEDYDVMKHDYSNVLSGSNDDYIAMFNLPSSWPNEVTAFENLKAKLDVDDFIDYLLANFYLGNGDWDAKNWYVSRNHFAEDGRWRWHMWDGEHVMDDGSMAAFDVTNKNNSMAPTGLHQKWIRNDEYRMAFTDRVQKHFFNNGALTPENFEATFTNLTDQIDRAIIGESARWGDNRSAAPYTRVTWLTEVNRLLSDFIPDRRDDMLGIFMAKSPQWYPSTTAPTFLVDGIAQYGGDTQPGAQLTLNSGGYTMWYTTDGTDPRAPGGAAIGTEYTGAIALNHAVQVKARSYNNGQWSGLVEATFNPQNLLANLRISEIMYHPTDDELEFIELKNIAADSINLNLVEFTNGISYKFNELEIPAGGFVILAKNETAFTTAYGSLGTTPVLQWTEGMLDNNGEKITLKDALGRKIHSFSYNDSWYDLTDGLGFSLSIRNAAAAIELWDQKIGWRNSMTTGGSPGTDEVGLDVDSIVINEVMAHSHNDLPDWIELYNTTQETISIGGWYLSDDDNNLTKYQIPEGTELQGGQYIAFYEDTDFGSAFALSENGETVYLTSSIDGQLAGYQAIEEFDASDTGVSMGRVIISTGETDFVALSSPTPEGPNAAVLVGPIVISEIMYHPWEGDTGGEFIELTNISTSSVPMENLVDTEVSPGVFVQEMISWSFTKGIDFTFPAGFSMAPGERIILAKDVDAFTAYYSNLPQGTVVLGPFADDTSLNNKGEKLRLSKPNEQLYLQDRSWIRVDQVNYDDESPWPTNADGMGPSLTRISLLSYGNDPANWSSIPASPGK